MLYPKADHAQESVRTPSAAISCPICGQLLTGKQTVCSPKCRIARSRQKAEALRHAKEAKLRLLLRTQSETILPCHVARDRAITSVWC
jgi:predicted nucleic acid-binding Zn ribbon protein